MDNMSKTHKLTQDQIQEMRRLKQLGWTTTAIANAYGITHSAARYHVNDVNIWSAKRVLQQLVA